MERLTYLCFAIVLYVVVIVQEILGDVYSFSQNDIRVIHDRIELISFDKNVGDVAVHNTKYNRTTRTFGAEILLHQEIHPTELMVNVVSYRKVNAVYKKFAPVKLNFNACKALQRNSFGINSVMSTNGNITLCPIKKDNYYVKDFIIDESKLPPFIPEGDYKLDMDFNQPSGSMAVIAWYGSVVKR